MSTPVEPAAPRPVPPAGAPLPQQPAPGPSGPPPLPYATTAPGSGADPRPPAAGAGTVLLRVAGVLVVLTLLAAGAMAVVSEFFEQERTQSTSYEDVRGVVADTDVGTIEVRRGTAGAPVRVDRTVRWSFGDPRSSERVDGALLRLGGDCGSGWRFGECSVDYRVTVPPGTTLELTTATGSIEVEGADADVRATTSTGSLELTSLTSDSVAAQASTGSVELTFAEAPTSVTARTSTGSVEVVVPADGSAYAVDVRTSTGSSTTTVPVDSASPRRIEARSSTGSVEVRTQASPGADPDR